jgi:hypothetical protein
VTPGRVLLGVAVILLILGVLVHRAFTVAGVVLFSIGLRAAGQRPFAGGSAGGGADGYVP